MRYSFNQLFRKTQNERSAHYENARQHFHQAARELVEINNRARADGDRANAEVQAAIQRLNLAQEKMQQAKADLNLKYKPVRLTRLVKRKIKDTFARHDRRAAKDLLIKECGRNLPFKNDAKPKHLEQIRLAVLKLANGNLEELRRHIQTAKSDWRDVILAAESPELVRAGLVEFYRMDKETQDAITERDRQQYVEWPESSHGVRQ